MGMIDTTQKQELLTGLQQVIDSLEAIMVIAPSREVAEAIRQLEKRIIGLEENL